MAHLSPQQILAAREAYRDAFRLQQALADAGFIFTWHGKTREIRGRTAVHHNLPHHEKEDRRDLWFDERWKALRWRVIAERGAACEHCSRTHPLEVHHLYYFVGARVWDYEPEDLKVLCGPCHALIHHKMKRARGLLYVEVCDRMFRELVRRQNQELDVEEVEWEVNRALGWGSDATAFYDADNAGDWEAAYGEDLGDVLEEIAEWRERDDYDDAFDEFMMDLEYEGLGDD